MTSARNQAQPDASASALTEQYRRVRGHSLALTDCLAIEDHGVQPMDDASPPKWHLAHTTWFFETFLLVPFAAGYRPFHPQFEYLFNSYYNAVGQQYPRPRRGHLSRPTVAEVLDYRRTVDDAMQQLLEAPPADHAREIRQRAVLGLHHEQQHQELIVTDLKYNFGNNPLRPVYEIAQLPDPGTPSALGFTAFDGGLVEIGVAADGMAERHEDFVFDNETPAHPVYLQPYRLADRLVTCGEFLEFMDDGGYATPSLWLSDGWSWLQGRSDPAPLYWHRGGHGWTEYTLAGARELDPHAPVCHLNFYEADAFARWAGHRLPSEAEWEQAARAAPPSDTPTGALHPAAAPGTGSLSDLHGRLWQWTTSAYSPYPGYAPFPGALGEYNGKFMCNQLVLRGGSCATPPGHARISYRNFFYPPDSWQFTGIRLASDG